MEVMEVIDNTDEDRKLEVTVSETLTGSNHVSTRSLDSRKQNALEDSDVTENPRSPASPSIAVA